MELTGGCYCGSLRYKAEGKPMLKAQCHCRECQYITGGGPNLFMLMPPEGFAYTKGEPKKFKRADLDGAVTREFCAECGTHILTRRQDMPQIVLKIGTLDDPAAGYGGPKIAIYTVDKQPFHLIAEGVPAFDRLPNK
ncbi:MAG: GFA family protein [Xanthobacteraceae bacterium]|nr:GFA family protein [Xanthobacteraceae bacterium]